MNIKPHILLESGGLTSFADLINEEFDNSIYKITQKIPVSNVDVVIYDNPKYAIPEIGIGGYTPNANLIFIYIDPQFPDLEKSIQEELKRTLAHELHHVVRWATVGYGETLFEALITEGLADHFDTEVNHTKPEPWSVALTPQQISKYLKLAQQVLNDRSYSHQNWFFGSKEKNIPKWTGYSLGFYIVDTYLRKNPNQKSSTLYNTKAEEFRKICTF